MPLFRTFTLKLISRPTLWPESLRYGSNMFYCFEFDSDFPIHKQVQPVTCFQLYLFVLDRQRLLPLHHEPTSSKLEGQTVLIRRLKNTRAQSAMYINRGSDCLTGYRVQRRLTLQRCTFIDQLNLCGSPRALRLIINIQARYRLGAYWAGTDFLGGFYHRLPEVFSKFAVDVQLVAG